MLKLVPKLYLNLKKLKTATFLVYCLFTPPLYAPLLDPFSAAPCYPEISTRAKTPSSSEIGPAAQTREIPLLPLSRKCRIDVAVSKPVGVRW